MDFSIPEVENNPDLTLSIWPALSRIVDLLRIPTIALATWILFHSSTVLLDSFSAAEADHLTSSAMIVFTPAALCLLVAAFIASFRPVDRDSQNKLGIVLYGWRKRITVGLLPIVLGTIYYAYVGTSDNSAGTQDHIQAASIAIVGIWAALTLIFFLTSILATHEVTFGSPPEPK